MDIKKILKKKILLADGAMGTYFEQLHPDRGAVESQLLDHPDWLIQIYREYLWSGADILRTATFGCNHTLDEKNAGDFSLIERMINCSVDCAGQAVKQYRAENGGTAARPIYLAASIGPMKCATEQEEEQVFQEYQKIVDVFVKKEIELFFFETFSDINMARRIASYVKSVNSQNAVITNFVLTKMGFTTYGYSMQRVISELAADENIDVFGFNCGIGAAHTNELLDKVVFPENSFLCIMPNAGYRNGEMGRSLHENNCTYYAKNMKKIIGKGANIIGGCCGTTPAHIKALREILDIEGDAVQKKRLAQVAKTEAHRNDKNHFLNKLAGKEKVFVVELDAPFGANPEKFVEGAFRLKENGVDLVTISDSPMAKARADAFQMAVYVKNRTGLDIMPHITCRDRNLIALHSAFLGAYINDIRNLLIITGDPVAREDKNVVSPVFDFNSIKLMQYVKNMNCEFFAEDPICFGGALNYGMGQLEKIAERMKKKMENGCSYFLTQPIYSDDDIKKVCSLKEMTGALIICGIMPLVSYKNAKFMQNEMPGIHVPDEIVNRYHGDQTRQEAEKTAIDISVSIGKKMADFADGYYIMTPFHRVTLVNKIINGLR